jgi:hypothetical protein
MVTYWPAAASAKAVRVSVSIWFSMLGAGVCEREAAFSRRHQGVIYVVFANVQAIAPIGRLGTRKTAF